MKNTTDFSQDELIAQIGGANKLVMLDSLAGSTALEQYPPNGWEIGSSNWNSGWIRNGDAEALFSRGRIYSKSGVLLAGVSDLYKCSPTGNVTVTGNVLYGAFYYGGTHMEPLISIVSSSTSYTNRYLVIFYSSIMESFCLNTVNYATGELGGSTNYFKKLYDGANHTVKITSTNQLDFYTDWETAVGASDPEPDPTPEPVPTLPEGDFYKVVNRQWVKHTAVKSTGSEWVKQPQSGYEAQGGQWSALS